MFGKNTALLLPGLLMLVLLAGCHNNQVQLTPSASLQVATSTLAATQTSRPDVTATLAATETPTSTLPPTATQVLTPTADTRQNPDSWIDYPVLPRISGRTHEIFQLGQTLGNNLHVYSSIGDCQSLPDVFLGIYDTDRYWFTADDAYLEGTVDWFAGSFSRPSLAAINGMSAPSALSAMWADQSVCESHENPIQCEIRINKPVIMFINLGTNWRADASIDAYEGYLRQIIDLLIENGVIPVLTTKADNVEGNWGINAATVKLAYEYDIPLLNFWRAVQDLPGHGLDADRDYLYMTPDAWNVRNYTALRTLDKLLKEVIQAEP